MRILLSNYVKGHYHEIFYLCFFFIKQLPLGPYYTGKSLFAYGWAFMKIFDLKIADFGLSGVNDIYFLCACYSYRVVQFACVIFYRYSL
jgi:hypothetical protein